MSVLLVVSLLYTAVVCRFFVLVTQCRVAKFCLLHNTRNKYKWKNHFYKMKGDVGMSGHEKERKQEDAYTKIQTHS